MCNRPECETTTFRLIQEAPPGRQATKTSRRLLELAWRDGAECHYCRVPLIMPGHEAELCEWKPGVAYLNHCGCGKHGRGEWCGGRGQWTLPAGFAWPTIDHKVPRARGGSDTLDNLLLACRKCNERKGTRPYELVGRR